MRAKHNQLKRRTFLVLPAALVGMGVRAGNLTFTSGNQDVSALLNRPSKFSNPEIPKNWRDGPKSLDNHRFNPHKRSLATIEAIFRRKRKGFPHPAYGVMGTVLELRKPIGEIVED
jgi:hypothetical protein